MNDQTPNAVTLYYQQGIRGGSPKTTSLPCKDYQRILFAAGLMTGTVLDCKGLVHRAQGVCRSNSVCTFCHGNGREIVAQGVKSPRARRSIAMIIAYENCVQVLT